MEIYLSLEDNSIESVTKGLKRRVKVTKEKEENGWVPQRIGIGDAGGQPSTDGWA